MTVHPGQGPIGLRVRFRAAVALAVIGTASGCTTLPTGPVTRFAPPVRAITLVDWTADGYAGAQAGAALASLAATGANTVVVLVTGYQGDPQTGHVRIGDPRTPSPAAVESIVRAAQARGLRVALKLHVDLDDGSWRGRITPASPTPWFTCYRAFLLPWASLAQSLGMTDLVVGTELAGTVQYEAEWRRTIAAVRAVFDGGVLYAASWDEAGRVPFWDALDLVGIDFYFPVTDRRDAGRLDMLAGWQQWLDLLHLLHRQTRRDILLAEVGYRSVDGAGMAPHAHGFEAPLDLGEQADLYWAALQATGDVPWIQGLYWWNWPASGGGGPTDTDFTARGKPAAEELAAAWGGR